MLSKELEHTINLAFAQARSMRHEFLTVEHLLYALLDNDSAHGVLRACGIDFDILKRDLMTSLKERTPILAPDDPRDTQPTLAFQRVLQRSVLQVQSAGRDSVEGASVLVAIFGEKESQAVFFLRQQQVSRLDVVNFIAHGMDRPSGGATPTEQSKEATDSNEANQGQTTRRSPLELYAINLNEKAREGRLDPLVGRSNEVQRMVQILCRRRKNNPLLVGEAGVGKTAIVEGLAGQIILNDVPEVLNEAVIFSLDLGSLVAGTKYRGDFEKRLKGVLSELKKYPYAILFIDEIHTLIGAGSASGGVMDASNLIKPMLSNGDMRCIGATTYQEYRGIFEKDRALARRFQKVDVVEPTVEETVAILQGLRPRFVDHHQVQYSDDALQVAVELAKRHLHDRFLPDKAIDVIDEAGAKQHLLAQDQRVAEIGVTEIEQVIAVMANVPSQTVSSSDRDILRRLERNLKLVVFGQDEAIEALASATKMARAGLGSERRPVGSFLFAGPTGVGKTEVTRQLAQHLGIELIRFDMSEYMESHTVSRLIGAPPGYVGYDQGGLLTDAVYKHPHAVLLLDEIEKAHPDVFNLLLQVMDHGTLTDNNGRKSDFSNVILVMTTNAGTRQLDHNPIGFAQKVINKLDLTDQGELQRLFSPEFRNRLDSIIAFQPLSREVVCRIVDKFLIELECQLEQRRVSLEVDGDARLWLAEEGYDAKMGARPMGRVIQRHIKQPLAEELLFGQLVNGGRVEVSAAEDGLQLTITSQSEALNH